MRIAGRAREPGGDLAGRKRARLVMGVLALCGTVTSLQQSVLFPLLPELPRLLHTSVDNTSWLITATLLTGAVATPVVARLADMHGKRPALVGCLVAVICGSLLGALSSSLLLLLVARALQGVGMAVVPVGIAAMRDELPRDRLPLGVALMSATIAIGAGVGPSLSGVIVHFFDWHSVFWLSVALAGAVLGAVLFVLSRTAPRSGGTFDVWGAVLLSAGLLAVLLVISKGGAWGWTTSGTIGTGAAGLLVLLLWVPVQLRVRDPLVDVRTAARPAVLLVNAAAVLLGFSMFANPLVTTQLLQLPTSSGYGLGLDVIHTGLWMAPSALTFGLMAPVAATLTRHLDARVTLCAGALVMCLAYLGRTVLSGALWQIVVGSVLVSMGTSLAYAAMPTLIMAAVPVVQTASANGLNTLLRSVGTSTSSAATAALLAVGVHSVGGAVLPAFGAVAAVFWIAAAAAAVAALLTVPLFRTTSSVRGSDGAPVVLVDAAGDTATADLSTR